MPGTWVTTVFRQIRSLVDGPSAAGQADESLLDQFLCHRDESAFATLVKRHGPMVMGVCSRILGDKHLAEDAFQATFLALALKGNTIRKRGSVAGWLHAVAVRLARKLKAETHRSNKQVERDTRQPSWDTPMEASKREERDLVDDELERLPDKYRLPLLLCYFEGRTVEEAAAQLGWTVGKVKGLLDRGRERLRFRLVRRGVTLSTAATATLLTSTALSAPVPAALAAATVQAALHIVSGQTLAACGATEVVINLTRGALIMGPKKIVLAMALIMLAGTLGVGAAIWASAGNSSAPAPEPRVGGKAEMKLPVLQEMSKPVQAGDLEFQLVSNPAWPMPAAKGVSLVQFELRVTNRGKSDVSFMPIVGNPILQSADGAEIPMQMLGQNHLRALPKSVSIAAGKTITAKGTATLSHKDNKFGLRWEDEFGMHWSMSGIGPGKYLLSLHYKAPRPAAGWWVGDVRTATVPITVRGKQGADSADVSAYEKIGATFGWLVQAELGFAFVEGNTAKEHGLLPAFSFQREPKAELLDLKIPFGLLFESGPMTHDRLRQLTGLKNLAHLRLRKTMITDAGLKELAGCTSLSSLALHETEVTDAGLKELARLKNLTALRLDETKVSDAGLKNLAGLVNLSALTLGSTQVTDGGLKELAGLTRLTTFSVNFTQVTDVGLKELARFKSLTALGLATKQIGDAGLKELAGLHNVTTLFLGGTQVTDAGVKHLAGFRDLSWLVLGSTRVTDAGLKDLARHKKLNWLVLSHTQVTDAGLKELAGLNQLTELFLDGTQVTDAGLKELTGLNKLRSLFLRGTKVTDLGVAFLKKALPSCQIIPR